MISSNNYQLTKLAHFENSDHDDDKVKKNSQINYCNNLKKLSATLSEISYKCFLGEFHTQLYWGNIIAIFLIHILALYGFTRILFQNFWFNLIYGLILGGIGGFGVTAAAHRYYTHRAFKAKIQLQLILLLCYCVAGQNNLLDWVRDHRVHHKYSETDADPHDSRRGFFFSHVGWLCMRKKPQVIEKGSKLDLSDINDDKLVQFTIRYWTILKLIFCFIIPVLIPALIFDKTWSNSIWLNLFRYVINLNSTWCINSIAHMWGMKPFNKYIRPVDNYVASIMAMGEGYHNYHHSFPWDYRASEMGSKLNITTFWLNFYAKIGWAYDLKTTSAQLIENCARTKGDGSRH